MPNVELRLTSLSVQQLRTVAATLARHHECIASYNNGGSQAPHWAPIVHCDGPDGFSVYTPAVPIKVASAIVDALNESMLLALS